MSRNQKIAALSLLAVALIALAPLFFLKGADFGGSDDAGSQMVETIRGGEYTPWFTPVLERLTGGELPGEVETLFFCLQTGLGAGVIGFGFGYLAARKKYSKRAEQDGAA